MAVIARGLLRPFRRDQKNDFANARGASLFQSRAGQVLGTRASSVAGPGELRFRPNFGSRLHLLRHKKITPITRELARYYAQEALGNWDPRCRVTSCTVERNTRGASELARRALVVHVSFDMVDPNSGNALARGLRASSVLPSP